MSDVVFDWVIPGLKSFIVIFMVLNLAAMLLWIERKGSALIQNRVGANRASILGILPINVGFFNTLVADPMKLFTKEEFVPTGADRFVHSIAPFLALFPAVVTMVAVPFGDSVEFQGRIIELQAVRLDVGVLYVSALVSMGVYGVALAGWASNNRWALLGSIRGSAQMISYELAMGLALVSMILFYGTLDMQSMVRQQGGTVFGIPNWGILYQPLAFILILVAGIAESKRVPFDLPECESELISGYFTEYSGGKQASFMLSDFAESVMVAGLVTTMFFGGWQVPYLSKEGFLFPGMTSPLALPALAITLMQVGAFMLKVLFFCWFQILIRWTVPRFRYDQLMKLGWQGMVPLAIANLILTALLILLFGDMGPQP